jgi:ABC-type Zn uptake system ZnuABC Zn-binding protein ZnuA
MKSTVVTTALLLVTCIACGARAQPSPDAHLQVVTTTTVFADFVSRIGGNLVSVRSLVPRGTEVHTFDPKPADIQALAGAGLIVMNGLGLDGWLSSAIRDGGAADTPLLTLAQSVPGAQPIANAQADGGGTNPHMWMDVTYARAYAAAIAAELILLDPQNKPAYDANLAAYDSELRDLDTWIRAQIGPLPPDSRKVVSYNDAFPYFARAYGLTLVAGVLTPAGQDASATEIAGLITQIKNSHAAAILTVGQFESQAVQTIVEETHTEWVKDLYDDSLGDTPIDSYEALMRWDTNQITGSLK